MNILRNLVYKHGAFISAFVFAAIVPFDSGGGCWFIFHQPEVPEEIRNYKGNGGLKK
jgi:cyclic lactone autoinducer peptide